MPNQTETGPWMVFSLVVDQDLVGSVTQALTGLFPTGLIEERNYQGVFPHELDQAVVPVRLIGYLPKDQDFELRRAAIEEILRDFPKDLQVPTPVFSDLEDKDWEKAWQERYHPLPVGRHLVIVPSWLENPYPERIAIEIDPGLAFGSGTHPTTQLSMELLERYLAEYQIQSMIDIGCGSGILSITAAKLGVARIVGVDYDSQAVQVSAANATRNNVADRISFYHGSVADILKGSYLLRQAPLVIANIIAPILTDLFGEGLGDTVSQGGSLILSGILEEQMSGMLDVLESESFVVREQRQRDGWMALLAEKAIVPAKQL